MQTGGRKRTTPLIPRHLLERSGPDTLQAAPDMASAPMIDRSPAPPAAPSTFIKRAQAEKLASASPVRLASTDYGYVVGELKRIFITAAVIVALLIVVTLLRR
jgi:hypothetical protein